jgi:hypothetical protein
MRRAYELLEQSGSGTAFNPDQAGDQHGEEKKHLGIRVALMMCPLSVKSSFSNPSFTNSAALFTFSLREEFSRREDKAASSTRWTEGV